MSRLSRRECMTLAAAGALFAEGVFAAPNRDKKHGRGHAHHHKHWPVAGSTPDCLNGVARANNLAFGCALGAGLKKSANIAALKQFKDKASAFADPRMRALFVQQCGILVPENELKWYVVRRTPDKYDFTGADILMDFATRYKLAVRGHTLLWNRSVWMPEWVNKYDFGPNPATTAEKLMTGYIDTVCQRFGDRIFSYDVVNETISPTTGGYEDSPFTKALGPQVIDIAFHAARQAAPHAELVYNDYMGWAPKDATHRTGVLRLLERLKKDNVPVDCLGIQAHIGSNGMGAATSLIGDADETEWRKFLDEVTQMGYGLLLTEFDVNDKYVEGTIAQRDRVVADYAKAYLDIALSYPQLRYMMAWGLVDKYSWLQHTSPRPDGLPKRPCPYDDHYRPKPLREAIVKAFAAAPARTAITLKSA